MTSPLPTPSDDDPDAPVPPAPIARRSGVIPFPVWPTLSLAHSWSLGRRYYLMTALQVAAIAATLALPPVASAVGIPTSQTLTLLGSYAALFVGIALVGAPRARISAKWRVAITIADLIGAHVVCVGLAIASENPTTGLWVCAIMHAMATASDGLFMSPSRVIWLSHAVAPLVAIPVFLHQGHPASEALGGPLLFAVLAAVTYYAMADRMLVLQQVIAERDALRDRLQRKDLARDLHDAVGASLTLASMYADQLGHVTVNPAHQQVAALLAATTRSGLRELRVALDEINSDCVDAVQLEALLRARSRVANLGGLVLDVTSTKSSAAIGPRGCVALLRIFQEALQNCVRHAGATHFTVNLNDTDPRKTLLSLEDNGCGFDPQVVRGSGLDHMRARAEELGGTLTIASAGGTCIRVELPRGV